MEETKDDRVTDCRGPACRSVELIAIIGGSGSAGSPPPRPCQTGCGA